MQIKQSMRKEFLTSERKVAASLVEDLLADSQTIDVSFEDRTWLKADDPERFRITVKYRDEVTK